MLTRIGEKKKKKMWSSSSFMNTWHPQGSWMLQGESRPIESCHFERSRPDICERKEFREEIIKKEKEVQAWSLESKGKNE